MTREELIKEKNRLREFNQLLRSIIFEAELEKEERLRHFVTITEDEITYG